MRLPYRERIRTLAAAFQPAERIAAIQTTLRIIFTKAVSSSREVKAIRGVLRLWPLLLASDELPCHSLGEKRVQRYQF